jgi:subtilisin-like proprotein convertase family protein
MRGEFSNALAKLAQRFVWLLSFTFAFLISSIMQETAAQPATQPPTTRPVTAKPTSLRRVPDVRIPTDEWAVRLATGTNPNAIARELGAENLGAIGTLRDTFLFRFPRPDLPIDNPLLEQFDLATADLLGADARIAWFEQQVARRLHSRVTIPDPLFADQWHLQNTGQAGGTPGQDVNIAAVWKSGFLGSGVVIGIVDDGLQYTHPDLAPNYVAAVSYDFNADDADPGPNITGSCDVNADCHGTSVAGVAAARDDGSACGVGAAFRAGVAGLRLIAGPATDADEAAALTYKYNTIHIFNNSWGPEDDADRLEGPGTLARAALEDGVTNGRSGLGTIYMWAAGNGLDQNDNVNYDGYANSRFTIAAGAVDNNGVQSWYSEPGAAMLVTAPSDGGTVGITTTDLLGKNGYNGDDCTNNFGGTSSATPLVSGIVALVLEANPNLTWRDVQHILVETAVQNDPGDADWTKNGAGYHINHKYGFGRIDALAAVATAQAWVNVPPATRVSSDVMAVNQAIPDNSQKGVDSTITISDNVRIEHVEVVFNATHPWRGDLEVILTSPAGTRSVLAEKHGDAANNYRDWTFMSVRHWGETSAGAWKLHVADRANADEGTFDSWMLILHGTTFVDLAEIQNVANLWRVTSDQTNFNHAYDKDSDGDIDIVDIVLTVIGFGISQ